VKKNLKDFRRFSSTFQRFAYAPPNLKWFKKTEFWVALVGVLLAIISIYQTHAISNQEQRISKFDTLLNNQQTELGRFNVLILVQQKELAMLRSLIEQSKEDINISKGVSTNIEKEISLLSSELKINSDQQFQNNLSIQYSEQTDINRLIQVIYTLGYYYSAAIDNTEDYDDIRNKNSVLYKCKILFEGEFKLNRLDFGVGGKSFSMSDELNVELSILAKKS